MGNIGVSSGVLSRDGEKRRIPRPLVGVHSGKRAILRLGFSARRRERGMSVVRGGGWLSGGERERMMAGRRDRRSISRVLG